VVERLLKAGEMRFK